MTAQDPSRSPFPGMDPYLEAHWGDVHTSLTTYARNQLQSHLPPGLVARVEEYVNLELDEAGEQDSASYRPDVSALETSGTESSPAATATIEAAEPLLVVRQTDPETQRWVKVIEARSGRLITAIEFLSPHNKVGRGRAWFLTKQRDLLAAGVNIVEIDLVRRGEFSLQVAEEQLPADYRHPYRICVVRANRPRRSEMYPAGFREPLPTIRIPLRPQQDHDVPLNLQALIEQVYVDGAYGSIDYSADPDPPLAEDHAAWAEELLKSAGRRGA